MAAPRATQFIALRNLARGSHQVRSLHMTGPATYASPVLTKERPALNLPRDIAGLRAECKKRKIEFAGNQQELISRLHADELTRSRAFSTAVERSRRPVATTSEAPAPVRHFNTSRTLKAVKDSSTIDFAYLPDFDPDNTEPSLLLRVPILPDNYVMTHAREAEETVVMKPQISAMSADSVFLPMADMHDGHAQGIDFHDMADRVAASMRRMTVPVEEQASVLKRIWNDMVDDMVALGSSTGSHKKVTSA